MYRLQCIGEVIWKWQMWAFVNGTDSSLVSLNDKEVDIL